MAAIRPALLFDVETIADPQMARAVAGDESLSDVDALARIAPPRSESEEYGFPKPLYHRVVEISVCLLRPDGSVEALRPLGPLQDEGQLLRQFWQGFARHAGGVRLVTFNGRRFDLPVLVHRALAHGVTTSPWWSGDYRQRFRDSHLDLMDVLSDYGAATPLTQHEMAAMLGVPGKLGTDGGDVRALHAAGRLDEIAAYCTCDVATLTLGFARIGLHANWCTREEAARIESGLRSALEQLPPHAIYRRFLQALGSGPPAAAHGT